MSCVTANVMAHIDHDTPIQRVRYVPEKAYPDFGLPMAREIPMHNSVGLHATNTANRVGDDMSSEQLLLPNKQKTQRGFITFTQLFKPFIPGGVTYAHSGG